MTNQTKLTIAALLVVTQLLDVLTTHAGLANGATEANPLAAWGFAEYGEAGVYAAKAGVVALVLAVNTLVVAIAG